MHVNRLSENCIETLFHYICTGNIAICTCINVMTHMLTKFVYLFIHYQNRVI